MTSWIPLHVHSQYSILDALGSVEQIAARAAELSLPAVALTDNGNLYGAVEFYKACKKQGIKAIFGFEAYLAPGSRHLKKRQPGVPNFSSAVLLAKNDEGYHNLCRLSSQGFLEGFYYQPRIDKELLRELHKGLICVVGGTNSTLGYYAQNHPKELLLEEAKWYQDLFGEDFYLGLQRHQMGEEELQNEGFYHETWLLQKYQDYIQRQQTVNDLFLEIGSTLGVKCLATNDSHYLGRDDWQPHEIVLNVQSGEPCEIWQKDSQGRPTTRALNPKRHTYPSHELYFKSPDQMAALFQDLPETLSNTLEVARKCEVALDFDTKHYPVFIPPALENKTYDQPTQAKEVEAFLMQLCEKGIPHRYTPERLAKVAEVYPGRDPLEVIRERLTSEMQVVGPKGLCDYLLIVWDFIHWAKTNGIPVGPGRGSGAGSIILYLIGITDIEPLRFNLFFERFINPERLSYPDIDVDICMAQREKVIDYTVDKYGKSNVAQIITFGTMKAKMAIKDVARVLSVPLSKVNALAKLVPDDLNITLEKALEVDVDIARLYSEDEEVRRIFDMGRKVEGSVRSTGIHAAGVIIAGDALTDHIPLCRAKDSELAATQFSMKPVEQVGMLKVDFLGLKTLTSIQICVKAIANAGGEEIDWVNLPLDNRPAFDLLNQGKTLGVFQMESGGMQDLARQLHLDKFEEIIAVVSLYRPGPMDMIPSFIARKHGTEPIVYDHPWMEEILSETYGIMVYQEQVMQIAQKLANYSLGEGDVLRRAMGKKDAEQMAKEREKFREGAFQNGIDGDLATVIFDQMEKFAAYGFNKSHAAAYGFLTYVTAYLKANYPKEWLAALMTCDRDDTVKIAKFIAEAKTMGIAILPPDVNEAGSTFSASSQGIRFAISGIKGVGQGVVEAIIEEREKKGDYTDLYDFFKRLDPKKVGKKVAENLIEAGCFDFTGWSRDAMRESVETMHDAAIRERKDAQVGTLNLFSVIEEDAGRFNKPPTVAVPRLKREILMREKELLGFFLTGHPLDEFKEVLQRLSCVPLSQIATLDSEAIFRTTFIAETVATRISSKSQRKFAILTISDGLERFELPIWPELYEEKGELLRDNQLLYAVLSLDRRDGAIRLNCSWFGDLTQVNEAMIGECDQAFDKEKLRASKMAYAKSRGAGKPKKEEKAKQEKKKMEQPRSLEIHLEADQTRMSHLLQLKEVIQKNSGSTAVSVHFSKGQQELAVVKLEQQVGVAAGEAVREQLQKVPSVTKLA